MPDQWGMIIFTITRRINTWPVLLAMCVLQLFVSGRLPGQDFPDRLKIDPMPVSNRLKKPDRFFTLVSSGANDCSSLAAGDSSLAEVVSVAVAGGCADSVLCS